MDSYFAGCHIADTLEAFLSYWSSNPEFAFTLCSETDIIVAFSLAFLLPRRAKRKLGFSADS